MDPRVEILRMVMAIVGGMAFVASLIGLFVFHGKEEPKRATLVMLALSLALFLWGFGAFEVFFTKPDDPIVRIGLALLGAVFIAAPIMDYRRRKEWSDILVCVYIVFWLLGFMCLIGSCYDLVTVRLLI